MEIVLEIAGFIIIASIFFTLGFLFRQPQIDELVIKIMAYEQAITELNLFYDKLLNKRKER